MKRIPILAAAIAIFAGSAVDLWSATAKPGLSPRPDIESTYTITATLQVLKPFNPEDMQDDFQEARVVAQDAESCTVEVTYYPLYRPTIGENIRWREDYAGMIEYLRPTTTENWDEAMRRDLLAELGMAGIFPDELTDRQLVEEVSRWAMKRSKSTSAFAIWAIHYPEGKATVYPPLRDAFDREKSRASRTDEQMIEQEALGRSMFYHKVHGSCTSSSVYLTTIFRALGIPTRIVFCIPPFDPNDPQQGEMFYREIHHHRVRETVRSALDGMTGFVNHLFNEVFVGGKWVRLNYSTLGQPILDARYFGLLTHIYTCSDLSQVPLAETWGMRYFRYREAEPKLSSVNPYRMLSVRDHFGANAKVNNPVVPIAELRTATIVALHRPGASELPKWVGDGPAMAKHGVDLIIAYKEWLTGVQMQMRAFEKRVGREFLLVAPGQPEIRATLSGMKLSQGDGSFQAFGLRIVAADKDKVAPGAAYEVVPQNTSDTYRWEVAPKVAPLRLRD